MTECPTCRLAMESHSSSELMECCMKQMGEIENDYIKGICPNCRHKIEKHSDLEIAECTLAYLKSN